MDFADDLAFIMTPSVRETYVPLILAKRFPHPRAQIPFHHHVHRVIKWGLIIVTKSIGNFGYVQDVPIPNPLAVLILQSGLLSDGGWVNLIPTADSPAVAAVSV